MRLKVFLSFFLGAHFLIPSISKANITMEVPWIWQLSTSGDPYAYVFRDNTGPIGNSTSDSDSLAGNFVITYTHTNPGGNWIRIDPLPTAVTLNVIARWHGIFSNSTLGIDQWGITIFETYVRSSASVSGAGLSGFTPPTEEIGAATSKNFTHLSTSAISVGIGNTPFSGSVDLNTKFGFGSGTLGDFTTGFAELEFTGNLIDPTFDITYELIPAPSALLLLCSGLAGVIGLRRKRLLK